MTSSPTPLPNETVLETAQRIADDVLFATAQEMDRVDLVPRRRFTPLAETGLFGIAGPAELGAAEPDPAQTRRIISAIGGGCGATFFSWVQHHGVVRTISTSPNDALREDLLADMCSGATIAGVAFAHLRRSDRRAITAVRVDGGWQLDGFAPWATSWGIADYFAIAAESTDGELVWVVIPGAASAEVRPTPLALPVFASTGTVALTFDRCVVPDDRVAAVLDVDEWRETDRARAALGQPAVLGVADRALRLLDEAARSHDDPVHTAGRALERRLATCWRRDRELLEAIQSSPSDDTIADASDHRAACLDVAQRSTTALLAAVGGSGMDLAHPAQRLAREASFYVIQAQTVDGRAATLRAMS